MKSSELKQKISEEGYIHANVMFEIIGNPKDYVEKAIVTHLEKIEKDKDLEIIQRFVEKPEKQDKYWSTFAEVELLVKGLDKFTWMCMNFMPASIEILGPETMVFKARNLTNWLNDLLSHLHEISSLSQQVGQQNKLMLRNLNAIIRNAIFVCVDSNINSSERIAKKIGVSNKDLLPVFDAMIKEGTLKKSKENYYRK